MATPPGDRSPRFLAWWIGTISIVLPIVGVLLMLAGASELYRGRAGLWLLALGAGLVVLDLIVDLWWAHPSISRSDEPDLNVRSAQLIGRIGVVEETIEHGRGRIRIGDASWAAEGPACAVETRVRIVGCKGSVLKVEPDAG